MEEQLPITGIMNLKCRAVLFIDTAVSMLSLRKGFVDIFAVRCENNLFSGKLNHICRVQENQIFFGWKHRQDERITKNSPGAGVKIRLAAIAGTDCELEIFGEQDISSRLKDKETKNGFADQIRLWVEMLISGITSNTVAAPGSKSVSKGTAIDIRARDRISSDELLWIEQGCTAELTDESTSFKVVPGTWLMPLFRKRQLICIRPGTVNAHDTCHAVEKHGITLLRAFHENLLANLETVIEDLTFYTAEQIVRNIQQKDEAMSLVGQQAVSVMTPLDKFAKNAPSDSGWDYNVRESAEILLSNLGIKLRSSERYIENYETIIDYLKDITSENNINTRKIRLDEDWWKYDGVSFMAFFKETNTACAVISDYDHYVLVDPSTRTNTRIDRHIAAGLQNNGYTFYPVLPGKPVGLRDMFSLALNSNIGDISIVFLSALFISVLGLATPIITHNIIDPGIVYSNISLVTQLTAALIVVSISILVFNIIKDLSIIRFEAKSDISLQSAVIDRLFKLPLSFFRKYSTGDLASRTLGIEQIQRQLTGANVNVILGGIFSIVNLFAMFYYAGTLAVVAVLLSLISTIISIVLSIRQYKYIRKSLELGGEASGVAFQLCNGLSKIKMMDKEEQGMLQWSTVFSSFGSLSYKSKQLNRTLIVSSTGMQLVIQIMILGSISWLMDKQLSVGDFVAFLAAFGQFSTGMVSVTSIVSYILPVQALYNRLKPILTTLPEQTSDKAIILQGELKGKINARNVCFRYSPDTPYILDSISFDIRQGEFVAFVGPSGAGKSTLFKILLGLETIEKGSIFIDDYDISGLNLHNLRGKIGVVSQKSQMLPGSIYENIIGSGSYTMEEAWEAARQAGIDKDIESFPMGMYTVVSEDSGTFSGGQKQRILIARALIRKPKVILFDEATSSLDNKTQEIVARSLEKIKATRIVIAHRLSTIRHADTIYVLDKGRLVESGNYKTLMGKQGFFYRLAQRQII